MGHTGVRDGHTYGLTSAAALSISSIGSPTIKQPIGVFNRSRHKTSTYLFTRHRVRYILLQVINLVTTACIAASFRHGLKSPFVMINRKLGPATVVDGFAAVIKLQAPTRNLTPWPRTRRGTFVFGWMLLNSATMLLYII